MEQLILGLLNIAGVLQPQAAWHAAALDSVAFRFGSSITFGFDARLVRGLLLAQLQRATPSAQ